MGRGAGFGFAALGVPVPTPADREYYDQVTQLGSELADELRRLQTAEAAPAADPGRVVFLAEVTDDLDPRREEIRRYLSQAGMSVVPTVYYPHDDAAAFAKAMTADLARSKLFVQLLGALPGRKPPAAPNGFPTLQYELAQRQGIAILQWTSRDLELAAVEDPQQRALLEATTVRACPIEELKRTIVEELQRKPATPRERPGDALIFVNSDDADRLLAEHICAILGGGGVGYSLPMRAGDPAEVRSDLEDNLRTCDGLLLVYGVTTPAWIRSQLRQCRKVLSQREQPIAALAVFEGPPPDKVDFDVMLPSMQRLDCRKGLDQDLLKRFIRSLRP